MVIRRDFEPRTQVKGVISVAKQARALRTHNRVLDAAAHEFARHGYANANLQRIADRIGLTKGALYGHFSTKDELATALTEHLSRNVQAILDEIKTSSETPLRRLSSLVLNLGWLFETDRRAQAALRLQLEAARSSETASAALNDIRGLTVQLVSGVQREGRWDDSLPADPLADLVVAAFHLAFWAGDRTDEDRPGPSVPAMWDVLVRALSLEIPTEAS
jgi:AcrR family transcriptional regulator